MDDELLAAWARLPAEDKSSESEMDSKWVIPRPSFQSFSICFSFFWEKDFIRMKPFQVGWKHHLYSTPVPCFMNHFMVKKNGCVRIWEISTKAIRSVIAQDEYDGMTSVMLWRYDATSFFWRCLQVGWNLSPMLLSFQERARLLCVEEPAPWLENVPGKSAVWPTHGFETSIVFDLFELRNVFDWLPKT